MKKILFKIPKFIKSALKEADFPKLVDRSGKTMCEIALIGRSNVGKSSLINHLLQKKHLAKVSATPGKTQLLNFFSIDLELALVDLPGYGFASASKTAQEKWAEGIETYLHKRDELKLLLILLDIRRLPSDEDLAFFKWTIFYKIPHLVVFTKCDKVSPRERDENIEKNLIRLKTINENKDIPVLHFSIKDKNSRKQLIEKINTQLPR
ncbi:MAG: YihA family ribosome biogenesis GTP-binding protein [Simkaniaceae bacterium]|nr:YihA family ribosome biogenesis GTP-binding protein [Simkaniaceae bacterium]